MRKFPRFLLTVLTLCLVTASLFSCASLNLSEIFIKPGDSTSDTGSGEKPETPSGGDEKDSGSTPIGETGGTVALPDGTKFYYATEVASPETAGNIAKVTADMRDTVLEIYTANATSDSSGSGVFISATGVIITCYHVVEGATKIEAVTTSGDRYTATVVGYDTWTDLAVLTIENPENKSFPYATFAVSDPDKGRCVVLGEPVIAIGNSLGTLGGSVTDGIVAGLDREVEVEGVPMTLLQTNAAVSPGNSGGALFNLKGQLIGIVNAKSVASSADNIGYAIPSDTAVPVVDQLLKQGYVSGRPYLGIAFQSTSSYLTVSSYEYGTELAELNPDLSPDFAIKAGDIIAKADGVTVNSMASLRTVLATKSVGDTIKLTIYRRTKQDFFGQYDYDTYEVTLRVHEGKPA